MTVKVGSLDSSLSDPVHFWWMLYIPCVRSELDPIKVDRLNDNEVQEIISLEQLRLGGVTL